MRNKMILENKEELLSQIEYWEHEKIGYLEVNDKRTINRIDKKIEELSNKISIIEHEEEKEKAKKQVERYKQFIEDCDLKEKYNNWCLYQYEEE